MAGTSPVATANRVVTMPVALRAAGIEAAGGSRDSGTKMYCPWGATSHSDGGRDKAFRVWADHAWCFSCREWFSPVKLAARVWDVSYEQAAIRLLDFVGYKPADYAYYWQRAARPPEMDHGALAQALRNYCGAFASQDALLRPEVAEYMSRCLGFLTQVNDAAGAAQWLALAKSVMQAALRRGEAHAH
jgi:hypothetical protein